MNKHFTSITKTLVLSAVLFISTVTLVKAQTDGPGGPGTITDPFAGDVTPGTTVPFDAKLSVILLVTGLAFGIKRMKEINS